MPSRPTTARKSSSTGRSDFEKARLDRVPSASMYPANLTSSSENGLSSRGAPVVPGIAARVKTGDRLSVQIETGWVLNQTSGEKIKGDQISEYMFHILNHGGIKNLIRKQYEM